MEKLFSQEQKKRHTHAMGKTTVLSAVRSFVLLSSLAPSAHGPDSQEGALVRFRQLRKKNSTHHGRRCDRISHVLEVTFAS